MEITLGDATKLLDNIMANYSQWHTERSSSKKVHAIEEINVAFLNLVMKDQFSGLPSEDAATH